MIINYGVGNLGSIENMLKKIGVDFCSSSDVSELKRADKLILPGVGSFDAGMKNIKALGLLDILNKKVLGEKTPILGICLGMQLLTAGSEEGILPGLGWIDARTVKFKFSMAQKQLKIPHMGWNNISYSKECVLFKELCPESRFYFVHSYHVLCSDKNQVAATANYGYEFACAVNKGNIFGVQFHPEKSHRFGMQVLKNFSGV